MTIVYGGRGSGKTTKLIKQAAESELYIVTHDHARAVSIHRHAEALGLSIPFPLTYAEFCTKAYYAPGVKGAAVDDADMLLQYMAKVPVRAMSFTQEED